MAKRDLKLIATSQEGKKITTTMSHANPESSRNTLITFAQKLNALTTNTYEETDLVTTTILDTEDPPVEKTEPTLTITPYETETASITWLTNSSDSGTGRYYTISYNGDGQLYTYTTVKGMAVGIATRKNNVAGLYLACKVTWNGESSQNKETTYYPGTIYVVATEGENYAAKTIELAIE